MPSPLYIPEPVRTAITSHIDAAIKKAISGYLSGNEDEDTLTGQLGASLRIGNQVVDSNGWAWSIDYRKFRGRGPGATEKYVGADGIFEIRVRHIEGEQRKALLFQAKNDWNDDPKLVEQALLLSTWREAAFVLNYTPTAIEAFRLDNVISSGGNRSKATAHMSLAQFLGGEFLLCRVGDLYLAYDASNRILTWQNMNGEFVSVQFSLRSRIRIAITSPDWKRPSGPRRITKAEIHDHRMHADPEEILGVGRGASARQISAARNNLALTYHPDKFAFQDQLLQELLKRRMQETNQAYSSVKKK